MNGCGRNARLATVTDLSKRREDNRYFDRITEVRYARIDGVEAEIRIGTEGEIPHSWLRTLRVTLMHMQTGRKTSGGLAQAEIMAASNSGITARVKPLFPNIGQIGTDNFRVEITTESGLKKVLLCTPRHEAIRPTETERKESGPCTTAHVCSILPFRPHPARKPAA